MPLKTVVITGGTSGIGKETALALAGKDYAVYMLVRNTNKGELVKKEIITATGNKEVHVVYCDLADLKTVRDAAQTLKSKLFAINVLINNAGGIVAGRQKSKDGFEMTFAINHLGHFLLTLSIMPLLERGQARIINVSSNAHKMGKPEFDDLKADYNAINKYSAIKAYGRAKLFNIYFAQSLAERYKNKGITAYSLHPGIVKTNFGSKLTGFAKLLLILARPFMKTAQQGAQTSIYLATAARPDANSGKYFKNQKVTKPAPAVNDTAARNKLWQLSESFTSGYL